MLAVPPIGSILAGLKSSVAAETSMVISVFVRRSRRTLPLQVVPTKWPIERRDGLGAEATIRRTRAQDGDCSVMPDTPSTSA